MKKKLLNGFLMIACVMCMSITAFAASSTSFKVNNVSVTGSISYTDTSEYNPLGKDSVTAKTSAKASVDSIGASATFYYATGSTLKTATENNSNINSTSCSVTVKASTVGTGYKGTGSHNASHNGKSGSGTTAVSW